MSSSTGNQELNIFVSAVVLNFSRSITLLKPIFMLVANWTFSFHLKICCLCFVFVYLVLILKDTVSVDGQTNF